LPEVNEFSKKFKEVMFAKSNLKKACEPRFGIVSFPDALSAATNGGCSAGLPRAALQNAKLT